MSKEYVAKIIFDTNNANLSVDKTNKKVKDLGKSAKEVGKTGSKSISGLNDSLSALPDDFKSPTSLLVFSKPVLRVSTSEDKFSISFSALPVLVIISNILVIISSFLIG